MQIPHDVMRALTLSRQFGFRSRIRQASTRPSLAARSAVSARLSPVNPGLGRARRRKRR